MREFVVPPVFLGQTVIIVGGGPSLTLCDAAKVNRARLAGRCRVLAVNDAVYAVRADWLHGCDLKWWRWHVSDLAGFDGFRTSVEATPPEWDVGQLHETGVTGFDTRPGCIRTGGCGVYQGIHIAIHAGARRVILLGVDMKRGPAGETHWHGGHPTPTTVDYAETLIPRFTTLLPAIAEHGVEVVNATPGSALLTFPLVDLEQALRA